MSYVPGQTLLLASQADKVIHRFDFLFPKPPAVMRTLCITTAGQVFDDKEWMEAEKDCFRRIGFALVDFDLTGKDKPAVANALHGVDMIYVIGGNTFYLLEQIKRSGFEEILRERLQQGVLYVGSSAGTIVACPHIAFIEDMDNDISLASLKDHDGMNLVDFTILPHVEHETFGLMAQTIAAKAKPDQRLIGLRDDQAIVVRGCYAEVY